MTTGSPQYFKSLENYHHDRKIKRGGRSKSVYRESFYGRFYRKRQMKIELVVKFARRQMNISLVCPNSVFLNILPEFLTSFVFKNLCIPINM